MRFYEPIAVGLFVVTVLAASYMLGKRMGYEIGYAQGFERANTDAFAEGHVSGYNQAMDTVLKAGVLKTDASKAGASKADALDASIAVNTGIKSGLEMPQIQSVATN